MIVVALFQHPRGLLAAGHLQRDHQDFRQGPILWLLLQAPIQWARVLALHLPQQLQLGGHLPGLRGLLLLPWLQGAFLRGQLWVQRAWHVRPRLQHVPL